ncbi:hypothetical protein J1N35_015272 [Gossypium stocksii]|uniref:RNase H type-1 domain-containing protein n=1 Tax=Gossypium stocksii TaxID=47602 RepID=A0A9D3VXK6_9ROSI|nr:hypothetical protein J1N35_015272 [Gossypium stocksii]
MLEGESDITRHAPFVDMRLRIWLMSFVIVRTNSSSIPTTISNDTYVFLSTDGAVTRDSSHAATGGMVRDHDENWIMGFTRFLRVCTPFEAEVWSILDGILILLSKGYRRAIILTDNLEVFQILFDLNIEDSGITVL